MSNNTTPSFRYKYSAEQRQKNDLHYLVDSLNSQFYEPVIWLLRQLTSEDPFELDWWLWYRRWISSVITKTPGGNGHAPK